MYVFLLISSQLLVTRRTLTLKATRLLSSVAVENVVLGRCCQVLQNKRLQHKVAIAVEGCVSVPLPAILVQCVSVAPSSLTLRAFSDSCYLLSVCVLLETLPSLYLQENCHFPLFSRQ